MNCIPLGLLVLLIAGCGRASNEPRLVPVSGTVTRDGKPLSGATVTFIPVGETRGNDASGRTDSTGKYSLADPKGRPGTAAGTYKVTISRLLLPDGSEYKPDPSVAPIDSPARESLPPHYSELDRTRLEARVAEGGGTIDFPLTRGK
jgi:hypothetical protein